MFRFMLIASALIACAAAAGFTQDASAYIVDQRSNIEPNGAYQWAYGTSNGISAQESGVGGSGASGNYGYTSPEGEPISIQYTADENGYQASGSYVPTPPPIPDAILRSLEYIRTHPQYVEPQQQSQGFNRKYNNNARILVG